MSRESIQAWCERISSQPVKPFYCTGSRRFGPTCYDCSGFTYMAYKSDGKTIPADSALVARWGRDNGQVHPVAAGKLSDLVVHDTFGDPYNSSGPRGHIGLVVRVEGSRIITYESAGSHQGVGVYSRPVSFWAISVQHPDFANIQPAPPAPVKDDEMTRIIYGDQYADRWLTNFIGRRHIGGNPGYDADAQAQAKAIHDGGITDGAAEIRWPQSWVDQIPEVK